MEFTFVRMIEILIATDDRSQDQIARESGMTPQDFNRKLHNRENRRFSEDEVLAISRTLGVTVKRLMTNVSRKKLLDLAPAEPKSPDLREAAPSGVYPDPVPTEYVPGAKAPQSHVYAGKAKDAPSLEGEAPKRKPRK